MRAQCFWKPIWVTKASNGRVLNEGAGIEDSLPPHPLPTIPLCGYMCFSFTLQSTSEHFPLRASDILSPAPSTTFEKCAKITCAASERPRKIFRGSCYAFRRNYFETFLQNKWSYLGVPWLVCPPKKRISRSPTNYQMLAVAGLSECLSAVGLFSKSIRTLEMFILRIRSVLNVFERCVSLLKCPPIENLPWV